MALSEKSVPALVDVPETANLTDLVVDSAATEPHRVQLRRHVDGAWTDVTTSQFLAEVDALAKGLIAAGVGVGDRVGLLSRTRYEWTVADFAIWSAGAVPVPIYETSSAEQIEWILGDSGAVGCVVEAPHHAATVAQVRPRLPRLASVWVLDEGAIADLTASGAGVPDAEVTARRRALGRDSTATLVYTSGTTGRPKGCELTHGNFLAEVGNICASMGDLFNPSGSTLLFLPLAHVFGRVVEIGCLRSGVVLGHAPDAKNLATDLVGFRPTFVLAVPRVFETVYNRAQAKAAAEGKGRIFDRAARVSEAYSRAEQAGQVGWWLRLQHTVFDRLVYAKLRDAMGGRVRYSVSAGAPLGARLGHFYRGIGLTILEGYGLTEVSGASNVNRPDALRVGTVGQPVPGTTVRIAADGEVLIKGPIVFRGYHGNPAATAEAIDADGWFHSGDIGELDQDGYLTITGRKKELIVTAGGKNVAPTVLEDRIRSHPLVSQCMVVGDNRPYVAALVTLDRESLPGWLAAHGRGTDLSVEQAVADPGVLAAVQEAVDGANEAVSRAEAIRRFRLLATDFTEDDGHLTPTLKLKRGNVLRDFSDDVEGLYG